MAGVQDVFTSTTGSTKTLGRAHSTLHLTLPAASSTTPKHSYAENGAQGDILVPPCTHGSVSLCDGGQGVSLVPPDSRASVSVSLLLTLLLAASPTTRPR